MAPNSQQTYVGVSSHMSESSDPTDSDTSSDSGNEDLDLPPEWNNVQASELGPQVFFQHRRWKKAWRRFRSKPVRRFRRTMKKHFRKHRNFTSSHGKRSRGMFLTQEEVQAYVSKHARSQSSGKGFGRRGNPKGKDGKPLTCSGCGSTEHFVKNCPNKGKGKGGGPPQFGGFVQQFPPTPPPEETFTEDHLNHGIYHPCALCNPGGPIPDCSFCQGKCYKPPHEHPNYLGMGYLGPDPVYGDQRRAERRQAVARGDFGSFQALPPQLLLIMNLPSHLHPIQHLPSQ